MKSTTNFSFMPLQTFNEEIRLKNKEIAQLSSKLSILEVREKCKGMSDGGEVMLAEGSLRCYDKSVKIMGNLP